MWAWMPAFLTFVLAGTSILSPLALGLLIAAALHLSGAASTMAGGWASDRWGRKATLIGMAAAGALLSLVIGWSTALPTIVVLVLAFLYGFAALGDSGVLSTRTEEHTSELQSLMRISYAGFCLYKNIIKNNKTKMIF